MKTTIRTQLATLLIVLAVLILGLVGIYTKNNMEMELKQLHSTGLRVALKNILDAPADDYGEMISQELDGLTIWRSHAEAMVDIVLHEASRLNALAEAGTISRKDAETHVLSLLREIRDMENRYIFAVDDELRGLYHPVEKMIGEKWSGYESVRHMDAFVNARHKAEAQGSAWSVFFWPKVDGGSPARHMGYFAWFGPWRWMIGTAVELETMNGATARGMTAIVRNLRHTAAEINRAQGYGVLVFDGRGKILARSGFPLPENGGDALKETLDEIRAVSETPDKPLGKNSLLLPEDIVYSDRYNPLGWTVAVLMPGEIVSRPVERFVRRESLAIFAVLLILSGVALFWSEKISRPIRALARYALLVAASGFCVGEPLPPLPGGAVRAGREVNDLYEAVNHMTLRLREGTEELLRLNRALREEIEERRAAESALKESEARYRELFENAPIGIVQMSPDGRILNVNAALEGMLQCGGILNSRSGISESFENLLFELAREGRNPVAEVADATGPMEYDTEFRCREGSSISVTIRMWAVRNGEGPVRRLEGFVEDVSDRRRTETELSLANLRLTEEHEKRKVLSGQLIEMLETERKRIAGDLHDHVGQLATTLKMDIEMITAKISPYDIAIRSRLDAAKGKAIAVIREVKAICMAIRPSILDDLGLVSSLKGLLDGLREIAGIEVHFFVRDIPQRFSPEKEIAVYRIVQEALSNVLKHSGATDVFINLLRRDNAILLSIEDNGQGFDPNAPATPANSTSLGLNIIRERVLQTGGQIFVDSAPGEGALLQIEIPL